MNSYAFKVGAVECVVFLDGASAVDADRMMKRFPTLAESDMRQAYAALGLSLDQAVSSMNLLMIRLGAENILIDAGQGGKPTGGLLPEHMRAAGVDPASITRVIISHSHGDHVRGLLTAENAPVFPNAQYVISGEEWTYWRAAIETDSPDERPIIALIERAGLRIIAMNEQIFPGLTAFPIPGHTPGQIAVTLESHGETLIHLADLLHTPMQFAHPEWSPRFDHDVSVSVPTRRAALERAADQKARVMFYHLPFPGVGEITRTGEAFAWHPVE